MIVEGGKYYWYGTTRKEAPSWLSEGITLYSSTDLQHWSYEGRIFDGAQIEDAKNSKQGFAAPWRIERPKAGLGVWWGVAAAPPGQRVSSFPLLPTCLLPF